MTTPSSTFSRQLFQGTQVQCMASFASPASASSTTTSRKEMSCKSAFEFAKDMQKVAPHAFLNSIRITAFPELRTISTQSYDKLTLPQFKCLLKCAMKPVSEQQNVLCKTNCIFSKCQAALPKVSER
jgi:hypothetical protein